MGKITEEMPMNITVYLGANEGSDPALKQAVEELGRWIGESGNALVYGGSRSGLMGRLAHSVLTAGGEVTGVEPQFFIDSEVQYDGLTRLIITQDMTERKTRMIELGDAFIAFPGGTGTLEEIAEENIFRLFPKQGIGWKKRNMPTSTKKFLLPPKQRLTNGLVSGLKI